MGFKIEEYFVFQDKDILFSIFIELGKLLMLQFINGKLFTSNQFINKSCFKGQMSNFFKNINF